MSVAIRNDLISAARFNASSSAMAVTFQDGFSSNISLESFGMPIDRIRWETIRALPTGEAVAVTAVKGEEISFDAATLRYLADPEYAAELDAQLSDSQFSDEELERMGRESVPSNWTETPAADLRLDSWK